MASLSHVSAGILSVPANGTPEACQDWLAAEEPLEIRIGHGTPEGYVTTSIALTMRTPGNDSELAAGFLLSEGVVTHPDQITLLTQAPKPGANIVRADLDPSVSFDVQSQTRHFYTTSSCGICGKASLQALAVRGLHPVPRSALVFPQPLSPNFPIASAPRNRFSR